MLIEFKFHNYRSFRDETILSMEAEGYGALKNALIRFGSSQLLPSAAIFGKNGGGKSNVIRAFWLAVQFIRNAQRTQHENAPVPVAPFLLNDYSKDRETVFEFTYATGGIKYLYGFSATKEAVKKEYLYHYPKKQRALVFSREGRAYTFTTEKIKRTMVSEMVADNQLFFSVACTMNDEACVKAMRWFREEVFFSRDYTDIPSQLLEYSGNDTMLRAIKDYAKAADLGIEEMQFSVHNEEIRENIEETPFPEEIPEGVRTALLEFVKALSDAPNSAEVKLKMGKVTATAYHRGVEANGKSELYSLDLSDESDGTRKLMSLAPAIQSVLDRGGVLLVDELDKELHPILVEFLISKFQSKNSNPNGAQLIFTTHDIELLEERILRKDQLYFADKDNSTGVSELYSISEFFTRTTENIRKGYLAGKYGATPDLEPEEVL